MGAACTATLFWGFGNVIVRGSGIPGPQLALWRTLCGALIYTVIVVAGGGRLTRRTLRIAALGGTGFGLQASLYFTALQETTTASAAVIATLQPVMLAPVAWKLYGDRLDARRGGLMVLAVVGAVVTIAGSTSSGQWSLHGDLLAVAATAVGCLYFVGTKSAREHLGTIEYQAAGLWIAALVTLPGALLLGSGWSLPSAGEFFWPVLLVAIPGSGHLLMTWSQRSLSVAYTSTVSLNVLVTTTAASAVIFGDSISAIQLLGMGIVLCSLAMFVAVSGSRLPAPTGEL